MDKVERGKKYICIACMSKFYGLNKDIVICPKCGKEQGIKKIPPLKVDIQLNVADNKTVNKVEILEEEVNFDDLDSIVNSEDNES